ncbi:hypothetical protein [Vibrio campbellii]|uniref:hypothetical protein n=1 Tax=Vibrio campbellii TaxID=680 RepID=UPI004057785F
MKFIKIAVAASCISMVALPILTYIDHFGIGYWRSNSDWGSFGSFFGGVLGPVLSFISIIILWKTLIDSDKNNKLQLRQLSEQNFESSFIQGISILHHHALVQIDSYPDPNSRVLELMPTRDAVRAYHLAIDKGTATENQVRIRLWELSEPYFKTIFHLVSMLEEADKNDFNAEKFKHLLDSQLTAYEIIWARRVSEFWLPKEKDVVIQKWLE